MKKLFIILSILNLSCSTSYVGMAKDEYEENPESYSVLHTQRGCGVISVDGEDANRDFVLGKVYLLPGNHSIGFEYQISPENVVYGLAKQNFVAGVEYQVDCAWEQTTIEPLE